MKETRTCLHGLRKNPVTGRCGSGYSETQSLTIYNELAEPLAHIIPVDRPVDELDVYKLQRAFKGMSNGESTIQWKEVI